MADFLGKLFTSDFLPHGVCYRWQSDVVWLHVVSDLLIALAYYFIPFALIYIVRRRGDLAFPWMFWLFGVFILACGTTHLMNVWVVWQPWYRLDGVIKAITALASVPTAILLMRLAPAIIELPSPEQLREANRLLEKEILDRKAAEEQVRQLNSELERRVEERTHQLERAQDNLRRYAAELEQFAFIAAHDLQEPLRTTNAYTQLLARRYRGTMDRDADEFIDYITGSVRRMSLLVNDLHSYTEVMHDGQEPPKPVDLNAIVESARKMLSGMIDDAGASVEVAPLPPVPGRGTQLAQVFQNLISNAIKYRRPEEPPRISIAARREDSFWRISVEDNGLGIEPQYLIQIFGLFKRLHGRDVPGTGLGLAICQKVVEAHGGRIWVESEPGAGSTFHFTLPA